MNDERRKALRKALNMLSEAYDYVERVCDQEQDSMENYPESFQGTERFEKMEDAVENLNEATDKIDEAKDYIERAMQ